MSGSVQTSVLASRLEAGLRGSSTLDSSRVPRLRLVFGRNLGLGFAATGAMATALIASAGLGSPAQAQQAGYGQTLGSGQEQRVLDYGSGPSKGSSILDSANPIELMNKLRRGTAMDEATPPQDAVDAALKEFHSQGQPLAN